MTAKLGEDIEKKILATIPLGIRLEFFDFLEAFLVYLKVFV